MDPTPHNDREEPDIVAPGHQILMPTRQGFVINNGTSAAPHLTGGAGLLSQRKAGIRAEEVRAIVMASARHMEGSSRLSERDGAGAIMLAVADTVVANGLSKLFSNNGAASNFPINSAPSSWSKVRSRSLGHKMPPLGAL